MAPPNNHADINEEEVEEQFITEDDVYDVVPDGSDDEDHPMDDDDDAEGEEELEEGEEVVWEDNSIQHFSTHGKSVFTIAAHPSQPLAASGGEDDLGYIWNVAEGEEVAKLTGHQDSVSSIAWSFDGEMVASGGMDGRVRIWRRVGKTDWKLWEFLTELQGPSEVTVRSAHDILCVYYAYIRHIVAEMASQRTGSASWIRRLYCMVVATYVSIFFT